MKYRKKPVIIDAVQFKGGKKSVQEIVKDLGIPFHVIRFHEEFDTKLAIVTLEGIMTAHVGDWIIKGIKGEFYPCNSEVFERTYELVKE